MKKDEPIMKVTRLCPAMPKINVCCLISATYGIVHNHYGEHYFTSKDMCQILSEVRYKLGPDAKIVIFFDNASIHRSAEV